MMSLKLGILLNRQTKSPTNNIFLLYGNVNGEFEMFNKLYSMYINFMHNIYDMI